MLVEYAALPTDKGGWKVGVGALCKKYGVGVNYLKKDLVPNVLASPDDGDPFARAERGDKGVPVKLTPTKDAATKEQAAERSGAVTSPFKEMADHLIEVFDLKISRQAVAAITYASRSGTCVQRRVLSRCCARTLMATSRPQTLSYSFSEVSAFI